MRSGLRNSVAKNDRRPTGPSRGATRGTWTERAWRSASSGEATCESKAVAVIFRPNDFGPDYCTTKGQLAPLVVSDAYHPQRFQTHYQTGEVSLTAAMPTIGDVVGRGAGLSSFGSSPSRSAHLPRFLLSPGSGMFRGRGILIWHREGAGEPERGAASRPITPVGLRTRLLCRLRWAFSRARICTGADRGRAAATARLAHTRNMGSQMLSSLTARSGLKALPATAVHGGSA